MPGLQCAFCDHANPEGAKFCNACGSPLNLRPCTECDAVNEDAATACYKCGADLHNPQPEMAVSPATQSLAEPALGVGVEVVHKSLPESAGDIFALFEGSPALEADSRERHQTGVVHRAPRDWREHVFGALSATLHSSSMVRSASDTAAAEGRATLLKALLTGVAIVALSVSAYYAYHHPSGIGTWLNTPRSGAQPAASIPSGPQAAIGAASTSASDDAPGPQSDAAANAASRRSEPESGPGADVASAQREPQSDAGAGTGTIDGTDAPTVPPAMPADAPAATQAPLATAGLAAPTNAPETSATQPRTPGGRPQQGVRHASTNRSPGPSARAGVLAPLGEVGSRGPRRGNPSIAQCTEAVAALGFCNRAVNGESR
jgi:hypothetical protein